MVPPLLLPLPPLLLLPLLPLLPLPELLPELELLLELELLPELELPLELLLPDDAVTPPRPHPARTIVTATAAASCSAPYVGFGTMEVVIACSSMKTAENRCIPLGAIRVIDSRLSPASPLRGYAKESAFTN